MTLFDTVLGYISLLLVGIAVLLGPWFFGAWETWWFWPFTGCIFAASAILGLRMLVSGKLVAAGSVAHPGLLRRAALSLVPFLIYAFIRMWQADVLMDAERSFLLFLTPVLVGAIIVCGCTLAQARVLSLLVIVDLVFLGLYGVLSDSGKVLWADGYEQYAGRASGTYFCPDHFAGIMELLLALAMGLLLGKTMRGSGLGKKHVTVQRVAAVPLIILSLCGVWLSKSRGGGMTIVVMVVSASALALPYMVKRRRWAWQLGFVAVTLVVLGVLWHSNTSFMTRFRSFFAWDRARGVPAAERRAIVMRAVTSTPRYNMYSGALRAWKTKKLFGIGPGMHQHLWPHFAASPDGDREQEKRPSRLNVHYRSYEAHSDWIQLLEEYGLAGFFLFFAGAITMSSVIAIGMHRSGGHPAVFGGALVIIGIAFHSLGDFNLQMPATTWLLAAIVSVAILTAVRPQDQTPEASAGEPGAE